MTTTKAIETQARQFEITLMQDGTIPADFISQTAYILAQDMVCGLEARTPAQIAFLSKVADSRK